MSELRIGAHTMPAGHIEGENPLTPLQTYETASAAGLGSTGPTGTYPDQGNEASILPYRLQDRYDRRRTPRALRTVVLENEHLRATFLLELGGRLWSLVHKPTGRELLFVNPVFQPANLAVRDAWFAGGVEWNISIIGHSPFTCSPLFAARVVADDGTPVLRLYEWDRIRRVVFQIDCWLPDGSPFLLVRVRITNPNEHTVPMYWWSNIAVPERRDVRVLGPSDRALRHDYDGRLVEHAVPIYDGADVSYTTNRNDAADLYFQIPQGRRPWVAALDGEGRGLVHASTARLRGRKMFNWGMSAGGRRWQEFLSVPGQAYIEIQGGLAPTQGEYVLMPGRAEWSWLEAYGPIGASADRVHGSDWSAAVDTVEQELHRWLPMDWMERELQRTAGAIADRAPAEVLHHGSGWGALERHRRNVAGGEPMASPATPFPDDSLDEQQAPWLALLRDDALPYRSPSLDPGSLMVQPEWRDLLERCVRGGRCGHWLAWYHLGVMRYRAGDAAGARQAWERSLREEPSAWAYRDLAVLARDAGDEQEAADLWLTAARAAPNVVPLAIECAQALLKAGRPADLAAFAAAAPPEVASHGRIRLLRAMAALEEGDLRTVEAYFAGDLDIANIREKETILSDLWFGWHERRLVRERGVPIDESVRRLVRRKYPPPSQFDFRLKTDAE